MPRRTILGKLITSYIQIHQEYQVVKKQLQTSFSAKMPPIRKKNSDSRTREYLFESEIDSLRKAARQRGRHSHRDDTLTLLMFRHALRVSEVISLRWEQVDLDKGLFHVTRKKASD